MITREQQLLIFRAVDGSLDAKGFAELKRLLSSNDEALALYCRQTRVQADIEWFYSVARGLPEASARKAHLVGEIRRREQKRILTGSLGIAALLLLCATFVFHLTRSSGTSGATFQTSRIAKWSIERADEKESAPSNRLDKGDRFILHQGSVEMVFGKGVRAVIQAPSKLTLESDSGISMDGGRGYFEITSPRGKGFTVSLPGFDVVDLGTRFAINARKDLPAEIHVFQGEVELNRLGKKTLPLNGGQALREAEEPGEFEPIPVNPDPFPPALLEGLDYLHLDFEEILPDGSLPVHGNETGVTARLVPANGGKVTLTDGASGKAASFDGSGSHIVVENWDGISGNDARTVSFWCRVPKLSPNQLAVPRNMVIWGGGQARQHKRWGLVIDSNSKSRNKPGVLRVSTGYDGAICGFTRLNDAQWHHIAVTFDPSKGSSLEGTHTIFINGRPEIQTHVSPGDVNTLKSDRLSIGQLLDASNREISMLGEIDEVFVFRGVLPTGEIIRLASKLPPTWVE